MDGGDQGNTSERLFEEEVGQEGKMQAREEGRRKQMI